MYAMGDNRKQIRFIIYDDMKKMIEEIAQNPSANPNESLLAGSSLWHVRGFSPSILLSTIRLKVIAAALKDERAKIIQKMRPMEGSPLWAKSIPENAMGRPNRVCSTLTMFKVCRKAVKEPIP